MVLEISAHDRLSLLRLGLWQSRSIMKGGYGGEKLLLSFLPDNHGGEERAEHRRIWSGDEITLQRQGPVSWRAVHSQQSSRLQHTDFGGI